MLAALFPSTASALDLWKRTEEDPMEFGRCDPSTPCLGWDMRSVTTKMWAGDDGLRYLTLTLRSYYAQGGFASGFALDSKGDAKADYRGFLDQARLGGRHEWRSGASSVCGASRASRVSIPLRFLPNP
jgi:hypothetical protein